MTLGGKAFIMILVLLLFCFITLFHVYINKIFRTSVVNDAENASNVETCSCPPEYKGQFCEQCASGFTRVTPNGGPYVTCVTCQCNNHTNTCDPETGVCKDCQNNTTGMEYKINHQLCEFV